MLDDPSRALLTEVFGPGLIDAYGMGETGSCVIRIPGRRNYQVNSDLFVVNVYNEDLTGPALKGMMVITPLYKTELPLINYTSFDYGDSYFKKGLRFVRGIQGRMNDVIHHKDGSVTEWGNISPRINLAVQWAHTNIPYLNAATRQKGTLKEDYLRFCIGITFNERWFHKWKVK